jgi:hypothetical protein
MAKYLIGGVVVLLLFAMWWQYRGADDTGLVARNGLHSHPTLEIFVRGEKVEIPEGIGLGATHKPVHTHDDLPVIHLEFSGRVQEKDIVLGKFFESWGKDMREFGAELTMTVNGIPNTAYENYVMRDGDRIELHYE